MNRLFIIVAVVALFVLGMGWVSAVECNATIGAVPFVNTTCTVTNSLTLDRGVYYLNGTTGGNAIVITGNNILFDCNGSTIVGNITTNVNGIGKNSGVLENVTIRNCIIANYSRNIFLNNVNNFTLTNNTLHSFLLNGILLRNGNLSLVNSNTIFGNYSTFADGIATDQASNNNTFIYNNISLLDKGIYITQNSRFNLISTNYIFNLTTITTTAMGIATDTGANATTIFNNTINYAGWNGIDIESWHNVISFNLVNNSFHHGIDFLNQDATLTSGNNQVFNNSFYNTQFTAIYLRNLAHSVIYNNLVSNVVNKTFDSTGIANEGNSTNNFGNNISNNIITNARNGIYSGSVTGLWIGNSVSNVTSEVEVFLSLDGKQNNNTFIANSFDVTVPEFLLTSSNTSGNYYFNSQYATFFFNSSFSGAGQNFFNLYNISNALVYFINGSVGCTTISACDSNLNLTLTKNNWSYALNEYSVVEGANRPFNPIWFSSSSATSKTLTSNLSQAITADVVFNVYSCQGTGNIRYTSATGTEVTYERDQDYTCNNNQVTIPAVALASGDNNFVLEQYCDANTRAGFSLIMLLSALAVVGFVIGYVWYNGGIAELDIGKVVIIAIGIIFGVIMWQVAGQNLGGVCPG